MRQKSRPPELSPKARLKLVRKQGLLPSRRRATWKQISKRLERCGLIEWHAEESDYFPPKNYHRLAGWFCDLINAPDARSLESFRLGVLTLASTVPGSAYSLKT